LSTHRGYDYLLYVITIRAMSHLIISSLYFIFPAYIANMCPVIFGKLNFPFGKAINAKLFGENKTWRGFYAGYLGAFIVLLVQAFLSSKGIFEQYAFLDYSEINLLLYAGLFGIGAILGDLIESFFKRRVGIKSGQPWFPFDQLDFVIGALALLAPLYILPWENILALAIITPILHFLTNVIAYLLGLKKVWW